jgi:hypothetical protein
LYAGGLDDPSWSEVPASFVSSLADSFFEIRESHAVQGTGTADSPRLYIAMPDRRRDR